MSTYAVSLKTLVAGSSLLLVQTSLAGTISVSDFAPTVDGADIANNSGNADPGGNEGHMWSDRPHQGQSFLTGSNAGGYQLNAVTLKNRNNNVSSSPTFNLLVGTLSGSTFTQVGSTEFGVAPNYFVNDYITFTLDSPLLLDADTTYAFLWGSAGQGFVTANNLDGNTYTGGTAISSGDNNVPNLNNVLDRGVDRVFHVDLEAVPEPSAMLAGLVGLGGLLARRKRG